MITAFHLYSLVLSVLEHNFLEKRVFDSSFHSQNEIKFQTHRLYAINICWISNLTLETITFNFHLEINKLDTCRYHDWKIKYKKWTEELEIEWVATNNFGMFMMRNHVYSKVSLSRECSYPQLYVTLRSEFLTYNVCRPHHINQLNQSSSAPTWLLLWLLPTGFLPAWIPALISVSDGLWWGTTS